jgi:hypothetical protein
MKDNQKILVATLAAIMVVGILIIFVFSGGNNQEVSVTSPLVTEVISTEVVMTEEPKEATIVVTEEASQSSEEIVEEKIPPTVRDGLESTDPSVVNLASGEIQLVEFFAFW